jgi:hypothetical protein
LPPYLRQLCRIVYPFHVVPELARASRRQTYSGLISPLEEPGRRPPEEEEEPKAPPTIHGGGGKRSQDNKGNCELNPSCRQTLASFRRADIRDASFAVLRTAGLGRLGILTLPRTKSCESRNVRHIDLWSAL